MSVTYELTRCIVCGSAETKEVATAEEVLREVEELWAFHGRRLREETPTAHLMDRVSFSQHPPLRLVRCATCGLVYRNPIERLRELEEIYADQAPAREVMQALHDTQRASYAVQAERLTRAARGGTGIEVGSYVGAFLAAARDRGWQFAGVDVNECANAFTRSLGFVVHDGPIESLDDDVLVGAVAIWTCIDQLADPASAVRTARRHLLPGGVLALRAPNGACYASVRRLLSTPFAGIARAWLAQNNLLAFPYRYGFTPTSASRLVESAGFEVTRIVGDVLVPIADRWTKPWAAAEERVLKRLGALVARAGVRDFVAAPWFELYARAV